MSNQDKMCSTRRSTRNEQAKTMIASLNGVTTTTTARKVRKNTKQKGEKATINQNARDMIRNRRLKQKAGTTSNERPTTTALIIHAVVEACASISVKHRQNRTNQEKTATHVYTTTNLVMPITAMAWKPLGGSCTGVAAPTCHGEHVLPIPQKSDFLVCTKIATHDCCLFTVQSFLFKFRSL